MADNVELNAATGGASIATDDAGVGGHVQIVKLAISTDASATPIPAEATNGLDVDVTRVIPGTAATALGKAEDAAHSTGDVGVMALGVRKDAAAASSGTDGDYEPLSTDGSGRIWANVGVSALPSGASTSAKQDTMQTALDAIKTALEIIDNVVSGSEAQVDIVAALPAGANAIGKLAANTGVDIGDVDVTSVIAGTGATNLGKAEDAAHTSGDTGVMLLAVREATATDLSALGTDGDYEPLQVDANGKLWVNPGTVTVASHAVTNAGTFAVQVDGSALTALQLIDDAVFAEDVAAQAADKGFAILAVRRDADTTLVDTDNDYANLQVDANGYLKVEIFDGGGSHTVDNAGTFAVQVDGSALTALQVIDNPVIVDDAAFTPATTSVMMAGFEADESSTDSVDEGDGGAARMTLTRKLIVTPQPHTAGGLTIFRSLDIDESEEEVKATAGVLYSIAAFNRTAAPLYLKFYNLTAANTTVGTSTPVLTFVVPANADSDGAGFILEKTYGWTFDTAISVAATTGVADADTGAPGANDCVINLGYL